MRSDELIDDVARQMTAVDARPALRARVMAGIGEASQDTPRRWLAPVATSVALAAVALAWFLPSSPGTERAPVVAELTPVIAAEQAVAGPSRIEVARATSTPSPARRAAARAAEGPWVEVPMADVPTLPPLAGPPPIEIEPISWDDVTVAPLNVELIEVKALVVEPVATTERSGA